MTDEEREAENVRESMFVLNDWAAKYFQDVLHNSPDGVAIGMQYFRSRGFRDDTIHEFGLGYCPRERNSLADAALAKGFKEEFILKTGLCYKRDDGRLVDRFSGRVIFPVHTVGGRVVAFGGRVLNLSASISPKAKKSLSQVKCRAVNGRTKMETTASLGKSKTATQSSAVVQRQQTAPHRMIPHSLLEILPRWKMTELRCRSDYGLHL